MDQVKFFIGCLPQLLLRPLLNTLSHLLSVLILFNLENNCSGSALPTGMQRHNSMRRKIFLKSVVALRDENIIIGYCMLKTFLCVRFQIRVIHLATQHHHMSFQPGLVEFQIFFLYQKYSHQQIQYFPLQPHLQLHIA